MSACAPSQAPPPNHAPLVLAYAEADAEHLWSLQATTSDPLQLMMIEAELGSRGQFESGERYLGSRTSSAVGSSRYARPTPTLNDKDCSDFASTASAQRFFLSAGGPTHDPHGLDRDGDGSACEWGTTLRAIATSRNPAPAGVAALPLANGISGGITCDGVYSAYANRDRDGDGIECERPPSTASIGVVPRYVPTYSVGRVHVRGYYRKDGTYVRSHTRRR